MTERTLDIEAYLALRRVQGFDLSPDGRTIVLAVQRPFRQGNRNAHDLYRVPESGSAPAERLTVGDVSDHSPVFLPDGSVAFLSNRGESEPPAGEWPDAEKGSDPETQAWRLPAAGEARPLTRRSTGLDRFLPAREGKRVVFSGYVHAGTSAERENASRQEAWKKEGVTAQVFESVPMRYWDRFFGPTYRHVFVAEDLDSLARARDLTPGATFEHDDVGYDLSPDGRLLALCERRKLPDGLFATNLRLFDLESGEDRMLTEGDDDWAEPRFSRDGRTLFAAHHENVKGRYGRRRLCRIEVATAARSVLTDSLDLWPGSPVPAPDGSALFFTADEKGHHPVFRLDLGSGKVTRLTRRGVYEGLQVAADGSRLYAIGHVGERPPEIASLDPATPDQDPRWVTDLAVSALAEVRLSRPEEHWAVNPKDGRKVHSFLYRPAGTPPAKGWPLLLWIHGGPLGAYHDGWHWRWNPQLYAARGYAVLTVNPRISTGYGQDYIEEGFNKWGGPPYDDLMAAVDHAAGLPGIDGSRMAAMGGSYGGYMANWVAGHTDRFKCIVTHASLWNLLAFYGTTDFPFEWEREFGHPVHDLENYEAWSPHRFIGKMRTPMLVIHGQRDYRVAVSEGYQLFVMLQRMGVPSRLLDFPDENHWVLKPRNIALWNRTVLEWLDRWV